MMDGTPATSVRGVWRSRGYGWIVELNGRGLIVHHVSQAGCSTDPRSSNFAEQFAFRRIGTPADELTLTQFPGENHYVFDRLPRLPDACRQAYWTSPQLFEHFAASYREHYAFFREHGFDWEARVRTHRPLVTERTSPRVLFAIFSDMLDDLGDAHVGMNTTFRGEPVAFRTGRGPTLERINAEALRTRTSPSELRERWLANYANGIRATVLGGRWQEASDGKIVWGRIGTDVGYINFRTVEGFAPGTLADNIGFINGLMDRILAEFEGVTAVIVDATVNFGGYDRLGREIVGHFTAAPTPAYTKRPYGAPGAPTGTFHAEPSAGRRFLGAVYLLTSDFTVSGGEILTMTMRVLPNVTQVGTRTRGALSDRLTKALPDGSDFSISNEIYLDPEGKLFEAIGVPPHRTLAFFPADDMDHGHPKAIAWLVQQIRAGRAARAAPGW